eukprot:2864945-Pyramimonas_sp.AAC.1
MACACRTILCAVSDNDVTNFNFETSPFTARCCPVPGSEYVPRSASTMLIAASSMYAKSRPDSSSTCSWSANNRMLLDVFNALWYNKDDIVKPKRQSRRS